MRTGVDAAVSVSAKDGTFGLAHGSAPTPPGEAIRQGVRIGGDIFVVSQPGDAGVSSVQSSGQPTLVRGVFHDDDPDPTTNCGFGSIECE